MAMKEAGGWWGCGRVTTALWGLVVVFALLVGSGSAENDGVKLRHLKFESGVAVGGAFRLSDIGATLRWPANKAQEGNGTEASHETVARVIAGTEVKNSGFFPEVVAIASYDRRTGEVDPFCTGALIDDKLVLTAAHCVEQAEAVHGSVGIYKSLFVCGGTTNMDNPDDATCVNTAEGYMHDFDSWAITGRDVAVLGLESSLVVGSTKPGRMSFEKPKAGTLVYAVGYGMNTHHRDSDGIMRYGDALFVPSDQCAAAAAMHIAGNPDIVCMNGNYDGSGGSICRGDSGSPMVVRDLNNPDNNYIIGVASMKLWPVQDLDLDCDWRTEGIYMGLHSDSHREFIQEAVGKLNGSMNVVGGDAAGLSCEGREQLCEGLPGNRTCLMEEGDMEECCRNSGREVACLKAVAEDCADDEALSEAVKADAEKFEQQCLPKHGCGKDDVDRCVTGVDKVFENTYYYHWSTPDTFCDEVAAAYTCLGRLLERCEGNEIVLESKVALDAKAAEGSCSEELCNVRYMTECSKVIDQGSCRTVILQETDEPDYFYYYYYWGGYGSTEDLSGCCDGLTKATDCLMAVKYACGEEEVQATETKLNELDWLRENGNCDARGETGECDVGICTSYFNKYCEDYDGSAFYYYSWYSYYYDGGDDEGEFVRWCCEEAKFATLCLEKSLEECVENREELESEHARISQLFPEESCHAYECNVSQCVNFESLSNSGNYACYGADFYRNCLRDLAGKCEEDRQTIEQGLQQLEDLLENLNCDDMTCNIDDILWYCTFYSSWCGSLEESKKYGDEQACCIEVAYDRKCLVNAQADCPNNSSEIEDAIRKIDENFPEEQCLTHVCTGDYCTEYMGMLSCNGGISELLSPTDQTTCCNEAEWTTWCLNAFIEAFCVEKPEELEKMIDFVEELYPEEQCTALECKAHDCEPSATCVKDLLWRDDEFGSFGCCKNARSSRGCYSNRKEKCGDDPDAIAFLDAQLVKLDEALDGKCGNVGCQDRICLQSMGNGPCASLNSPFPVDSFYGDYWESAGVDDRNATNAFLQVECCESVADARQCLQSQLEMCPGEKRAVIEEQIAELEAEHPEQQCQDLFCSADHCGLYFESEKAANCTDSSLNSACCETAGYSRNCLGRSSNRCSRDGSTVENSLAELQTRYPEEACGCLTAQHACLTPMGSSCLSLSVSIEDDDDDDDDHYYYYRWSPDPTLSQCCARTGMVTRCLETLQPTCPDSVSGELNEKLDEVKQFESEQCCESSRSSCLSKLDRVESSCPTDNASASCCSSWWDVSQCLQNSQISCGGTSSAEVEEGVQKAREFLADCEGFDTPGTTDRGRAGSCFPGSATVQLENGSVKSMMELEAGDRVLVGDGLYSDVIGFTHRLENQVSEFVTLHLASGAELSLSPSHYAIVGAERKLVPARLVRPGSVVLDGHGKQLQVVHVSRTRLSGLYNPHTLDGKIAVNGVMASTYTEAVHPTIAQLLLTVVRVLYRMGIKEPLGSLFYGTVLPPFLHRIAVRISALVSP